MKFKKNYWENPDIELSGTNTIKERMRYLLGMDYFNRTLVDSIRNLPKNAKVADCGCGLGINLLRIKEIRPDLEIVGIDIGEHRPLHVKEFYNFDLLRLTEHEELKNKFDLVISMHVIEHINDTFLFMDNLNYILKDGGCIYIECPSIKNLFLPGELNFYSDPTHIRPYSKIAMKKLCNYLGYIPIKAGYNFASFIGIIGGLFLMPFLLMIKYDLGLYLFVRIFGIHSILLAKKG